MPPWAALVTGAVAGLLLPLGVYLVERVIRLPDGTAAVPLGIVGGLLGPLAVALFADGRWGQGWNRVGLDEYHAVAGQGVTGFLPAAGFVGDGTGQLIAQLAGIGAIGLLAFLVGWLVFLALNVPYRPRRERKPKPETTEKGPEDTAEVEKIGRDIGWLTSLGQSLFPPRKRGMEPREANEGTAVPEAEEKIMDGD